MRSNSLDKIVKKAKDSTETLLKLSSQKRRLVLSALAREVYSKRKAIVTANKKDVRNAERSGKNASFVERLSFDENMIEAASGSLRKIAAAKDNLFEIAEETKRPSGIKIKKIRVPLGLLAIIFESRPNVTLDAFALAFKSGNAVILKGGKEITSTNRVLVGIIRKILGKFKISDEIIQNVSGLDRQLTLVLLRDRLIDCLIPRGGKSLIEFVKNNASIPIIETGASVVHTYVDGSADLELAKKVILNAKTRRVSICNALDVLIIDKKIARKFLELMFDDLAKKNVELRADNASFSILKNINYPRIKKAGGSDFDSEFLDYVLAIKTVNNFEEVLGHIKKHSLGHSEAILTKNKKQVARFFQEIDAACLYWNTSTQFSDGGEFGMGGEIGISTQKLHARGPFSYRELTTYKYLIESKGAIRK